MLSLDLALFEQGLKRAISVGPHAVCAIGSDRLSYCDLAASKTSCLTSLSKVGKQSVAGKTCKEEITYLLNYYCWLLNVGHGGKHNITNQWLNQVLRVEILLSLGSQPMQKATAISNLLLLWFCHTSRAPHVLSVASIQSTKWQSWVDRWCDGHF